MSVFPAQTFKETTVPGETSRLATLSNHGSALYVIHKDITRTMEEPNTINELITGTETEAQYSVVLNVPGWARGYIPYAIVNLTVASTSDAVSIATATVVSTGTNPLRYHFLGRIPNAPTVYTYNASTASVTSAVDPSTYGYWCSTGAWRLSAATGGGSANIFMFNGENSGASPNSYGVATASSNGLQRSYVVSLLRGGSAAPTFETLLGHTKYGGSLSTTNTDNGLPCDSAPYIPLLGCDQLTCVAIHGPTAPTVTAGVSMVSGTATNVSVCLAVRFVS